MFANRTFIKKEKSSSLRIHSEIVVCLFIVVAALAVFYQVQGHQFIIFDDNVYVVENSQVQSGVTLETISWAFSLKESKPMYWHPLTWISHMLDVSLYGLQPGKHHIVNLIFHILCSLLLFYVFLKMTGEIWKSALVALIFAIHPINVESVSWVAERKNVLSTFFWMVTILFYIRYVNKNNVNRYIYTLIAFLAGLLSKPMLVTLPFVLLLLDFWPIRRLQMSNASNDENQTKKKVTLLFLILEKIPFFIIAMAVTYIAAISAQRSEIIVPFELVPIKLRIENALVSYILYLIKMAWPVKMAIFYPYPKMIAIWKTIGAVLILLSISGSVIYFCRRKPFIFVGWFWFLGTLVPVSGIVQVGLWPAYADRWAYVPMIGILIIVIWLVPDIYKRIRFKSYSFTVIACIIIILFMFTAWLQASYWFNSITIFKRTVEVTHENSVAHNNLGTIYAMKGMIKEAAKNFSIAFMIDPKCKSAGNNLGRAYIKMGRIDEGILQHKKVLETYPNNINAIRSIAYAYKLEKEYRKAIEFYKRWVELQPNNSKPYYEISKIYSRMNNKKQSSIWLKKAKSK